MVSQLALLYDAAQAWIDDRVIRLGAAVAYYSLFALIPVLFLSVTLASLFIDAERVAIEVGDALSDLLGPDAAEFVIDALKDLQESRTDVMVSLVSLGVLLFSATLLFVAWKDVVDIIFDTPRIRGARGTIRRRTFGVLAVVGAGALLTLNLFAATVVTVLEALTDTVIGDFLVTTAGTLVPLALGALFVSILFKYTPEVEVQWKSTWLAASVSMLLLTVGAWGYGIYLDIFGFSSAAGALGSVFLGLLFVYYAAQILLYGIEVVRITESRSTSA